MKKIFFILVAFTFLMPLTSKANFSVTPLRVDLNNSIRTGSITVENHGQEVMAVQMYLTKWTQDAKGKDIFEKNNDLVFFPKVVTLEPGKKQLVRVGLKGVVVDLQETTYRLFIEKILTPEESTETKAGIKVRSRFGIPVFVLQSGKKKSRKVEGAIGKVSYKNGSFEVPVENTGTEYFLIKKIEITGENKKGDEVIKEELQGWYLLSGITRMHNVKVDRKLCEDALKLKVMVFTDKMELEQTIDEDKPLCPSQ